MITIYSDPQRGHIAILVDGQPAAALADIGPVLQLTKVGHIELSPSGARDLAEALNGWADRHHEVTRADAELAFTEAVTLW